MKNQALKIALIVLGVVAIGASAYFIFKKDEKDDDEIEKDDIDDKDEKKLDTGFNIHIVSTSKGNLNLRDAPSTTSNIRQSLPKGSEILARPSQTQGWHEVSDDGKKVIGFVSSQFITKK